MSIVKRRFFAGFMGSQARWLNSMAQKGYRLIRTGKLEYEFEECESGKYIYTVEYAVFLYKFWYCQQRLCLIARFGR